MIKATHQKRKSPVLFCTILRLLNSFIAEDRTASFRSSISVGPVLCPAFFGFSTFRDCPGTTRNVRVKSGSPVWHPTAFAETNSGHLLGPTEHVHCLQHFSGWSCTHLVGWVPPWICTNHAYKGHAASHRDLKISILVGGYLSAG